MANEALAWPAEPDLTDAVDGDATYNMGIRFSLVEGKLCYGIRWRVPGSVTTPPGGSHVASLWTVVGEFRIAFKNFGPVAGGYQDILFDTPVALTAGTRYTAAVHTQHYVFRGSGGVWPSSPSGNVVSDEGKLAASTDPLTYPASFTTALFYVSPLVEAPGGSLPSAAPSGLAVPAAVGTATVALNRSAGPAGLATAATLGQPAASRTAALPIGLAVTASAGSPAAAVARSASPTGLAVSLTLGQASAPGAAPVPNGVGLSITLGAPAVSRPPVAPAGIAASLAFGQPTAALTHIATPTGVAVTVSLGFPSPTIPVRPVTPRPAAVATARPFTVATPRP